MSEILADPLLQAFWQSLVTGEINLATGVVWVAIAALASVAGGALGGLLLAQKDLGTRLAAMIGGLFGPAGMIPAAIVGLIVLKLTF